MSYFWKIEEAVGGGLYIVLPGIYATKEQAEAQIARERSNQNMRAAQYHSGSWNGSVRVVS
jgi:hypothetical protein